MLPRRVFRFRRTTLMTLGCIGVLVGLALSRVGVLIAWPWLLIVAVFCLISLRRKRWVAVLAVLALGVTIGLVRGADIMHEIAPYQELYGKKVVLQVVADDDAVYSDRKQLEFDATNVTVVKPLQADLPGKLKIEGFGENMVYKGDVLEVEGKLYKMRGSRQGGVSFAEFTTRGQHNSAADTVRRNFAAGMQNALPEPLASFGLGILIGQRNTLPDNTANALAVVGLTHIIAVSGYNLTIIVEMIRRLTTKWSKYQGTLLAALLVGAFLLMTGFSAPIVRAAIISMLSIWAWYYGRKFKPVLLITLTAAATALWNPLYLWGDIGWYLSFLAFFGVLVIAPLAMQRIYRRKEPGLVGSVLVETTCAQLMTLPLILYIFQQVSFVSLISNLLVVPLIPVAMLLALIAGVAGMLLPAFAGWLAWPARLVLTYILDIAVLLSRVPNALAHYSLSLPGLVYLYALIAALVGIGSHKAKRRGTITDKNRQVEGV